LVHALSAFEVGPISETGSRSPRGSEGARGEKGREEIRNGRNERLEAMARERKEKESGTKTAWHRGVPFGRSQVKGIIYKYATRVWRERCHPESDG
jgi:hypothetical protein